MNLLFAVTLALLGAVFASEGPTSLLKGTKMVSKLEMAKTGLLNEVVNLHLLNTSLKAEDGREITLDQMLTFCDTNKDKLLSILEMEECEQSQEAGPFLDRHALMKSLIRRYFSPLNQDPTRDLGDIKYTFATIKAKITAEYAKLKKETAEMKHDASMGIDDMLKACDTDEDGKMSFLEVKNCMETKQVKDFITKNPLVEPFMIEIIKAGPSDVLYSNDAIKALYKKATTALLAARAKNALLQKGAGKTEDVIDSINQELESGGRYSDLSETLDGDMEAVSETESDENSGDFDDGDEYDEDDDDYELLEVSPKAKAHLKAQKKRSKRASKKKKSVKKLEAEAAKALATAAKLQKEAADLQAAANSIKGEKDATAQLKKTAAEAEAKTEAETLAEAQTKNACNDPAWGRAAWDTFTDAKRAEVTEILRAAGCPGFDVDSAFDTDDA